MLPTSTCKSRLIQTKRNQWPLQDQSPHPKLLGEVRSPKHLWHHDDISQNELTGIQGPSAHPIGTSWGLAGRDVTSLHRATPAETEPRHGENHPFGVHLPATAEMPAPTHSKPLRRKNYPFIFFQSSTFHSFTQSANQPNLRTSSTKRP